MYRCHVLPRILASGALLFAVTIGCSEKPRAVVDAASAADAAPDLPANARVALTKPNGASNADRAVLDAQDVVRLDMANHDAWIALGRAWLRKAEASNEPLLRVNADACASVVLAKDPDHVAAADLRGTVLRARHEWAEARQLAERVTQ